MANAITTDTKIAKTRFTYKFLLKFFPIPKYSNAIRENDTRWIIYNLVQDYKLFLTQIYNIFPTILAYLIENHGNKLNESWDGAKIALSSKKQQQNLHQTVDKAIYRNALQRSTYKIEWAENLHFNAIALWIRMPPKRNG